nr:type II toxin-antitoxin system RelE/ParE family toxin [Halegenticoccus tardaugens]
MEAADEKTSRVVKEKLGWLSADPYPGRGRGDKEKLPVDGVEQYRMHISRTWTAFYTIREKRQEVRVHEIVDIGAAHKRYGY